jgi:hypothetical protein
VSALSRKAESKHEPTVRAAERAKRRRLTQRAPVSLSKNQQQQQQQQQQLQQQQQDH